MYMHVNNKSSININSKSGRYCLSANLRKACRVLASLYSAEMSQTDLRGTQFTLLSAIAGFGEVTVSELGEFLTMDQTTATRGVQVLKKMGYIDAVAGEDKRTRVIKLSKAGEAALGAAYPKWLEAQTKVWDYLGDEKAVELLELSEQLVALTKEPK